MFALCLISVRITALPSPGILAHFFEAALCCPAKLFLCLCRVSVAGGNIARTALFNHIRDFLAAGLAKCLYDIQNAVAVAITKILNGNAALILNLL